MPMTSWLQFLTRPRHRIPLLIACILVLAAPILVHERAYYQIPGASWRVPTASVPTASALADFHRLSQGLFPASPAAGDHTWMAENERTIISLFQFVILASSAFSGLLYGENGGEAIWANSTLIALRRLGYSYLYSRNRDTTIQLYFMFRALVPLIIMDAPDTHACFHDDDCVLLGHKPHGIPTWKMLSFHFWESPDNPLGQKWTLSPEDVTSAGNTYLGYSIEPQCATQPFIPHRQRKQQAYVLAKEAGYFNPADRAYSPDYFADAAAAADVQFLAGVREQALPEYFPVVAQSRVLVGVGVPATSPTPYEALCLGVPFINPIHQWDADDPGNRTQWVTQHSTLKYLDPPYVYNVFKGDRVAFVKAVVDAIAHPIDSFVLEDMRMRAVEGRVAAILETDWKGEAARVLTERKASGVGETFWL
ncbi:hypothetical protein FB451DRAFT_1316911 [Mycena latifolia]|nr:hypothetical protein FB451DRAFT_1316911 [Mycena latifolia]